MQIAVLDRSEVNTDDVVFAVAACNVQMYDHLAPSYDVEPWPIVHYRDAADLPVGAVHIITVGDTIDPGALGDHNGLGVGRVLYRSNPDWVQTLSHEIAEMFRNVSCNIWLPHPTKPGYKIAYEASDPVQRGRYEVTADVMGEKRTVEVSNFVTPAFYVAGSQGPWDWLGELEGPGEIGEGGYQIVQDEGGVIAFLPHKDMAAGQFAALITSDSRAMRIMKAAG